MPTAKNRTANARKRRKAIYDKLRNTQISRTKALKGKKGNAALYQTIRRAMENQKYNYRTVEGIAKEAMVTIEDVEVAIKTHPDDIVVLYRRGENGERLITTRNHYNKKATVKEKLMGAVLNCVY